MAWEGLNNWRGCLARLRAGRHDVKLTAGVITRPALPGPMTELPAKSQILNYKSFVHVLQGK